MVRSWKSTPKWLASTSTIRASAAVSAKLRASASLTTKPPASPSGCVARTTPNGKVGKKGAAAGSYSLRVVVTGSDGQTASDQRKLTISRPARRKR